MATVKDRKYDWYTVRTDPMSYRWVVHGFDTYPRGSVLAGQHRKVFLGSFDTLDAAITKYPKVTIGNELMDPGNTFNHLPDSGDL